MMEDSLSSSLDPISIIAESPVSRSGQMASPLKSGSHNIHSPTRTMILNAPSPNGQSPWRLKVTVEAARNDLANPGINRQVRAPSTVKVPIRDVSDGENPPRQWRSMQKPTTPGKEPSSLHSEDRTPPRRRLNPTRVARAQSRSQSDSTMTALTEAAPQRRRSRRQRKTLVGEQDLPEPVQADEIVVHTEPVTNHTARAYSSPRHTPPVGALSSVSNDDDIDMPTFQDYNSQEHHTSNRISPEGQREARGPVDSTIVQNEEFSMISVDSLSSHHSAASIQNIKKATRSLPELSPMSISYLPSSPPAVDDKQTPQIDQTPQEPPALKLTSALYPTVTTPHRESAVRTGRVLQDIVRSPGRSASQSTRSLHSGALFSGFSTDIRRELRQSLHIGAAMAVRSPATTMPQVDAAQDLSTRPTHPSVDHRLPTPDDKETGSNRWPEQEHEVSYPNLTAALHAPSSTISRRSFDDMSWAPTGPAVLASPLVDQARATQDTNFPIGRSDSDLLRQSFPEATTTGAGPSSTAVQKASAARARLSQTMQEQSEARPTASSPRESPRPDAGDLGVDKLEQLFTGQPAPRRSKIPRTWRRTSGHGFTYSDSPQSKDASSFHAASSLTARRMNGVATPPPSDELEGACIHDSVHEDQEKATSTDACRPGALLDVQFPYEAAKPVEDDQEVETPQTDSSCGVIDGRTAGDDHTGLYWQSTRPSGRRGSRSHLQERSLLSELLPIETPSKDDRRHSLLSSLSDLHQEAYSSFAPDAGVHDGTSADRVPTAGDDRSTDAESYVSVGSEGDEDVLVTTTFQGQETTQGAVQSDPSSWDTTGMSTIPSYEEHLNLDSPTKVAVRFNDSSMISPETPLPKVSVPTDTRLNVSKLSPSKKWASLFEDGAPLGGQELGSSQLDCARDNVESKVLGHSRTSIMARMTASFWGKTSSSSSAQIVTRISQQPYEHKHEPGQAESRQAEQVAASYQTTVVAYAPTIDDDTIRLRRRYGLLASNHPFTLAHARTLHRLYQSVAQHPENTIVPLEDDIPPELEQLIGQPVRQGSTTVFTESHVLMVQAFMRLLCPDEDRERLEAQGGWGDVVATRARGWDSKGRHGTWFAFTGQSRSDKEARGLRGKIEAPWVLEVLGGIIAKHARA